MLAAKVVAAIVFIWVIAALLGGFMEGAYLDGSDQALLNKVLFYNPVVTEGTFGATEVVSNPTGYFDGLWKLATFQFAFITDGSYLVWWIVFAPLTAFLVYGIIMTVIGILRGTLGSRKGRL